MANHLTPEELSKELGIDRQEVIRVCVEEGVPIYQGKIDKTLFQAQLEALGVCRNTEARRGNGTPAQPPSSSTTPTCAPVFASTRRSSQPPSSSARHPTICGPSLRRRCA